jgi:LysR substrate binding domain
MLSAPPGPFATRELFADPFVILASPESRHVRPGPVSVEELVDLPLSANRTCRSTGEVLSLARERGVEPNVVHRSDDNGTIHAGGVRDAVALVPSLVADAGPQEGVVRIALGSEREARLTTGGWQRWRPSSLGAPPGSTPRLRAPPSGSACARRGVVWRQGNARRS